jgi:ribosome recycling factor
MMEDLDDVLLEADDKMNKSVEFLHQEFAGLRTGKASPSLVENIMVDYYGTQTRIRQIAGIATPEARLIVINPYDPTSLAAIEKAIHAANIGISPISDGRLIRIPIPELSEERRKDLVKIAHRMTEEAKVSLRNVRREANEQIKELQKGAKITEDDRDEALKEIQKYTDDYTKKIDDLMAAKEKDVLAV